MKRLLAAIKKLAGILFYVLGSIFVIWSVWGWVFPVSDKDLNYAKDELRDSSLLKGKELAALGHQAQEIAAAANVHEIEALRAFTEIIGDNRGLLKKPLARETVVKAAINLGKATETAQPEAAKVLVYSLNLFGAGPDQAWQFANILIANAQDVSLNNIYWSLREVKKIDKNAGITFAEISALIQILSQNNLFNVTAGIGIEKLLSTLKTGPAETNPAKVGLFQALKTLNAQILSYEDIKARFGDDALYGDDNTDMVNMILRQAHTFEALVKKLNQEADRLEQEQQKKN